jgi:hypothetical protein
MVTLVAIFGLSWIRANYSGSLSFVKNPFSSIGCGASARRLNRTPAQTRHFGRIVPPGISTS